MLTQKRIKQLEKEELIEITLAAESGESYGDSEEDEQTVLKTFLSLSESESVVNKKIKDAEATLEKRVLAQYPKLDNAEIKKLVLEKKWMNVLQLNVQNEMDSVSHRLAQRIKELAERYATTLPQLTYETEELIVKVNAHLKKMGFTWK